MRAAKNIVIGVFFGAVALGFVPLDGTLQLSAAMSCQITDVTPGGCAFAQTQPECHCDFVGTCPNSNSCLDAWSAAIAECDKWGAFLEGFMCTDPVDPPTDFTFSCGPLGPCPGR